ncbi:hypothetical protein [Burkholderia pyrrocinia]|uniref:hypothetical protein n=1 Tax=Burkholderia pyrrocinia TaxID=60550 RepID=UPI00158C1FCA|nr:hypothetical protein [Burkholderia pyrrocinia]
MSEPTKYTIRFTHPVYDCLATLLKGQPQSVQFNLKESAAAPLPILRGQSKLLQPLPRKGYLPASP